MEPILRLLCTVMWIEAAAKIYCQDPQTFFVVCGSGPLLSRTKQLAWKLGIGERVIFPGVVEDMSFAYAAADLVMLASSKEGTPNVLIEAQAMGVPVVTTPALGSSEAVAHGTTGLITQHDSVASLADAALSVLHSDEFRSRARCAGPEYVERRFGLDRMVEETIALYSGTRAIVNSLRGGNKNERSAATVRVTTKPLGAQSLDTT